MGIRKSKITPSINVDDMLKSAEISNEIEEEKQDTDKLLVEIREAKETLLKIQQDLQETIKAKSDTALVDGVAKNQDIIIENQKAIHCSMGKLTSNQVILEDRMQDLGLSDAKQTEIQGKFDEIAVQSANKFTHAVQDICDRYIKRIESFDQAFIIPPVAAWCLLSFIFSLAAFFGLIVVTNALIWDSRMIWHITFIISGFEVVTVSAIILFYKYLMKDNYSRRY